MITSRHARTPMRLGTRVVLAVVLAGVVVVGLASPAPAASPTVGVVSSLVTMQPLDPVTGAASASLTALRGEAESFQVSVTGPGGGAVNGVDVALSSAMTGPGGETLPASATTISFESYTRVWTPSDQEGLDPNPSLPARQRGWCQYFQTNPVVSAGTCGIPVDRYDPPGDTANGTPYNSTWKCGKTGVAPVLDVRRCLFPDALIPRVDPYYGQARSAFPFNVPAGENRTVWVDVLVPSSATPGTYTGSLRVTATAMDPVNVPVTVTVVPTRLPASGEDPSLDLEAGVRAGADDGTTFCQSQGCGATIDSSYRTQSLYVRSALENRLPLTNLPDRNTPYPGENRTAFDKWIGPYLTGSGPTATIDGVAPARLPAARTRNILLDHHATNLDWQRWTEAMSAAGVRPALAFYCDEVLANGFFGSDCANPYDTKAVPGYTAGGGTGALRSFLVGNQAEYNIAHGNGRAVTANARTLTLNTAAHLHPRNGTNTRPTYTTGFLAGGAGRRLWGYDSNNAFGSGQDWTMHQAYNGFPAIGAVDQPATSERAAGFTAWSYQLGGHFYYASMHRWSGAWNSCAATPGNCLYDSFGGHGDGTLFYPGPTSRVGGTQSIPIESMRLKRYRDGSEDYTILRLLETGCVGYGGCTARTRNELLQVVGGPSSAEGVGAMGRTWRTSIGANRYEQARTALVALLPRSTGPSALEVTGRIVFASDRDGDFDIYSMDSDGTDVAQLTNRAGTDRFPAWSPDGLRLAWANGDDIWVADADGLNPVNLTGGLAAAAAKPAWSTDGTTLYFTLDTATDPPVVAIMGADGTGLAQVVTGEGGAGIDDVTVAPDGTLTFTQGGADPGLFKASADGTGRVRLTTGIDEVADIDPSGDALTFSRSTGGLYDVHVAQPDGTDSVNVTETVAGGAALSDFQSTFSPTGGNVAFASTVGGDTEIWVTNVHGGEGVGSDGMALTTNTAADLDPDWAAVSGPTPFMTWTSFVERQYVDILGRAPTGAELSQQVPWAALHPTMRGRVVDRLRDSSDQTTYVDPVARLYRAYFLRPPDRSGLDHWVAQRRAGRSLQWISNYFAASPEFRARYGSLTNRQFVELIYTNVLGRPFDQEGLDFWTNELDTRRTRGWVMLLFSESSEYKRTSAVDLDVSLTYLAMLRRPPTAGELGGWRARASAGAIVVAVAESIIRSGEYESRL